MPSLVSHAIATGALGTWWRKHEVSGRVLAVGIVAAMAPDLDVIGFRFGVAYGDVLGHRGLSHSLAFALMIAAVLSTTLAPAIRGAGLRVAAFLFVATASHGVLDAMTDGGLGVAFFSPFRLERYFFPWRPIPVSPIGVGAFLSARGAEVLRAEALWIWLPAAVIAGAGYFRRSAADRGEDGRGPRT